MGGGSGGQRGAGHHFFPHKQQPGFVQVAGVGPVKVQGENTVTPEVGMWDGGYGGGGFAGVGVERISEEVRLGEERRTAGAKDGWSKGRLSLRSSIISPAHITKNLPLVASLLAEYPSA